MAPKKNKPPETTTQEFEQAIKKGSQEKYTLKLYIAGITPRSTRAVANIKKICETYLKGRYRLEVIDIYQQPTLPKGEQIIAAPTLIKKLPQPLRKFIGDMADTDRILVGLDLTPANTKNEDQDPGQKS
jgi:circadian clock protein KaiB